MNSDREALGEVRRELGARRSILLAFFAFSLVEGIAVLMVPLLLQMAVDIASVGRSITPTLAILAVASLLTIAAPAATGLRSILLAAESQELGASLAKRIVAKALHLAPSWFQMQPPSTVLRGTLAVYVIKDVFIRKWQTLFIDVPIAVFSALLLASYSPWFLLSSILILLCAIAYRVSLSQTEQQLKSQVIQWQGTESDRIAEMIRGIQSIKIFGVEGRVSNDWKDLADVSYVARAKLEELTARYQSINVAATGIDAVSTAFVICLLLIEGGVSPGFLLAVLSYKAIFNDRCLRLFGGFIETRNAAGPIRNLSPIINSDPEPYEASPISGKGDLILSNVSFLRSDGQPILDNVSFSVLEGQTVSILGVSGAGKTTLVKLICGLLDPSSGEISLGAARRSAVTPNQWRSLFSVALQDDIVFTASLLDNITMFDATPDRRRVEHAMQMAGLNERSGLDLDCELSDVGARISGGERQRVLLARALYKKAVVTILDEATSHLDAGMERNVLLNVTNRASTTLIVSHRPALLRFARLHLHVDGHSVSEVDAAEAVRIVERRSSARQGS